MYIVGMSEVKTVHCCGSLIIIHDIHSAWRILYDIFFVNFVKDLTKASTEIQMGSLKYVVYMWTCIVIVILNFQPTS